MSVILKCDNLTKRFKLSTALDNLNLNIESGRIVGLLGPNGSGKTTLIKLAAGLLTPSSGTVLINGLAPCAKTKARVSYLPDRLSLPINYTAQELISFYADFYVDFDIKKAEEMIKSLNLSLTERLTSMSKGTQEKMQLILVMSRNADLYLLDEPIGGVDPAAREYILNTIIRNYCESSSVIFSTHLIQDVEKVLDDVVFINRGTVVLSKNAESLREENGKSIDELFREVFKC